MAQLVGLIDLCHGGLIDFAVSPIRTSELRGFDQLEQHLRSGDILVGDRLYSSFEVVARSQMKGVEFIGRPHQARRLDFRTGKKIGPDERIQVWKKPPRSAWCKLTREQWDKLPEEITVRIIRTKGPDREGKQTTRYVVTMLLDAESFRVYGISGSSGFAWTMGPLLPIDSGLQGKGLQESQMTIAQELLR